MCGVVCPYSRTRRFCSRSLHRQFRRSFFVAFFSTSFKMLLPPRSNSETVHLLCSLLVTFGMDWQNLLATGFICSYLIVKQIPLVLNYFGWDLVFRFGLIADMICSPVVRVVQCLTNNMCNILRECLFLRYRLTFFPFRNLHNFKLYSLRWLPLMLYPRCLEHEYWFVV
jgi:hypothetical protein